MPMAPLDADYDTVKFAGRSTFVNVPHSRLSTVLAQYLQQKTASPHNTSAVFIVPEWGNRKWFRQLAHFEIVKRFSVGTELFSAPPVKPGGRRRYFGHLRWATLVLYDPPVPAEQVPIHDRLARNYVADLPCLSALKKKTASGVSKAATAPSGPRSSCWQLTKSALVTLKHWCCTLVSWFVGLASACAAFTLKALGWDGSVMYVRCHLVDTTATALIDSGASRCFINAKLAKRLGFAPIHTVNAIQVTLADSRTVNTSLCLPRVKMRMGSVHTWCTLYVLDDLDDDIILGMDWLERENPQMDFRRKTFTLRGRTVYCMGAAKKESPLPAGYTPDYLISKKQLKRLVSRGAEAYTIVLNRVDASPGPAVDFSSLGPEKCHPAVQSLLSTYPHVFTSPHGMPPDRPIKHTIELEPGFRPPARAPYRMSTVELQELKKQLTELIELGFIQPSSSPFASPVLLVPKPNGTWRLCVDYRALNMGTIKSMYPLPRIDDLFQQLHGAKFFSKLDFTSGYWQIEVDPADRHKTAFTTRYGLFEWRVMPMGLTSAPGTFQRAMNHLFHDLLDKGVVVYLDDVLIYSRTLEEHLHLLELVLQRLHEHQFHASLPKCMFAQERITFLGHVLSAGGIQPLEDKVKAVRDWPRPSTVHDVRSFLGMCSFYRKFVRNFAHIAAPLHELTKGNPKKKAAVVWTDACEVAFNTLKDQLCEAPVLILPDPTKPFVIHTDASDFAAGSVLMQETDTGLHPVEYYSRKLKGPELRYDTREREMLTIRESLRHWNHLVAGVHTDIFSDHDSLKHFFTQRDVSKRDARWIEELQALDISIWYHEGKSNVVADALSRRPDYIPNTPSLASLKAASVPVTIPSLETLMRDLRTATAADAECQRWASRPGYKLEDGLLRQLRGNVSRVVVPNVPSLRALVLEEFHAACGHAGMHKTLAAVTRHYTWKGIAQDVKHFVQSCHACQTSKPQLSKPAGLLQPLPVPPAKFHTIGIDQIVGLPSSKDDYDAILTVTDHLTKFVVLVPCRVDDDAAMIVMRMRKHVFSLFGNPVSIVSDRDPKYTSHFWRSVYRLLGVKLRYSTAYHPQSDGQSERTNQTVEVMLRCMCTSYGLDWCEKLPGVQFAINNNVQESTKFSPAQLMFGFQPRTALDVVAQSSLPNPDPVRENVAATEMHAQMQQDLRLAQQRLDEAKRRQAEVANRSRRELVFQVGDEVALSTANLTFDVPRKLQPRWIGPFKVKKVISPVAYELELPATLRRLHPVFHVSLLKPYVRGDKDPPVPPPPLLDGDGTERFEVQAIIGHRRVGRSRKIQYKVLWLGFPLHEATWEPEGNLDRCKEILAEYKRKHKLR